MAHTFPPPHTLSLRPSPHIRGILGLPGVLLASGWGLGLALLVSFAALEASALWCLGTLTLSLSKERAVHDYGTVGQRVLGTAGLVLVTSTQLTFCFLLCTLYVGTAGSQLDNIFAKAGGLWTEAGDVP